MTTTLPAIASGRLRAYRQAEGQPQDCNCSPGPLRRASDRPRERSDHDGGRKARRVGVGEIWKAWSRKDYNLILHSRSSIKRSITGLTNGLARAGDRLT